MSNKELEDLQDLQEGLDNYLRLLDPKTCDASIKSHLFRLQTAINDGDVKEARSLNKSLIRSLNKLNKQVGGHILIDLMNINDKVYKVHGLLLQSPSGNLYLYDPIVNGLTYFLPTNAANAPRAMRPEDKDKPLAYIDKVRTITPRNISPTRGPEPSTASTAATASTASTAATPTAAKASTAPKPAAKRVQGIVIPPVYDAVNTSNNAAEPPKPSRNGKSALPTPLNQYDVIKVKEPNLYDQVGDEFKY